MAGWSGRRGARSGEAARHAIVAHFGLRPPLKWPPQPSDRLRCRFDKAARLAASATRRIAREPSESSVTRIAFTASERPEALEARARLAARYGDVAITEAEVIVALGGDGFMLECFHDHMASGLPIYGMNRGSVGFLMNDYSEYGLVERIAAAERSVIHPLRMTATDVEGKTHVALAINEVSLLRQTRQAAKLRISIDGKLRLGELSCDGALVSTPAGLDRLQPLRPHGPIIPSGRSGFLH